MGRPAWQIRIITLLWPLRRQLARMVGWPILKPLLQRTFRGDQARFIPVQVELEKTKSLILPDSWVERLITESSFRFILHRCPCRFLEPCRNYPKEIGCLFLGAAARKIDPSLGKEVDSDEALAHHRRARGLGLIPMVGRLQWDSIWLGVRPKDRLLAICLCCECCCYFKIYRHLPAEAAAGLKKLEGLSVHITEACDGCGLCISRCFIGAIFLLDGKAAIGAECRGCGRCAMGCPRKAIKISISSEEPLKAYLRQVAPQG